jgi:hypothetical protein
MNDTVDGTSRWGWSWGWGAWGSGGGSFALVNFATIVKHTNNEWSKWGFTFADWSSWAEGFVAFTDFISATVLWSGQETTVWSSVVWSTVGFTIVFWEGAAINIGTSSFGADSLWATTVVLNTFIDLIFVTSVDHRFVASRSDLFKGDAFSFRSLVTDTWEASGWDTVPWGLFIRGQVNVPSVANWNDVTEVVNTFWWWWSNGGGGTSGSGWTSGGGLRNALLFAAVIVSTNEPVGFTRGAFDQSTSSGVASTFQTLATAVFRSGFDVTFFKVFTTFWFWAFDFSAFFSNANVFMATIVDFVRDQVLVEFTFWNFWAVPVEALDVTSFATVTDPANITLMVPRFSEEPWAFITVDASWWSWGSWSGWGSGSGNTFVGWATWTWWKFLDVTVVALDFFNDNWWAASFVATTLVSWTGAFVFFSNSNEFRAESVSFFTHWWNITLWSGLTFTVDDLFTAHVWIGVSVDWDQMVWATVWIQWSTAFGFSNVNSFVFAAVVSFTFVRGFNNVTDVNPGTVFQKTVFIINNSGGWGSWSGGRDFTIVSVFAAVFKASLDSGFTGATSFDQT